jgi:hypothetical protein
VLKVNTSLSNLGSMLLHITNDDQTFFSSCMFPYGFQ